MVDLHLDYAALGAVIRDPEMGALMLDAARSVSDALQSRGIDATVSSYVTDRAAAAVTMPVSAEASELKYGTLSDAARAAGYTVSGGAA